MGRLSSNSNDPMRALQQLINAQKQAQIQQGSTTYYGAQVFGGGGSGLVGNGGSGSVAVSSSSSMRRINHGDRVVLMDGEGQVSHPEANPVWGRDGMYVAGIVETSDPSGVMTLVSWDNGHRNMYRRRDSTLVLLSDAPQPKNKKFGTQKVELDTTKLDPLIIDPGIKAEIVALLQQHKHAKKIFEEWGLGEVIEYGRGMTIMFYGPPGTGKTFGAKCIAKALGKDVLVIGAAEIQSSEPGGANRNIQQAFTTSKEQNKVLFIDECDSLIANRANLGMILSSEINTLLTEIEKSEQVVILATNRIADMDPALERRLSLIIEFPMPGLKERLSIWKGLLPKKMPLHSDVLIDDLAKVEMSGGLIKNVVLQAARLAISDEAKEVSKKHFDRAIERTKSSQGLMGKKRVQHDGMSTGVGVEKVVSRDKISDFLKVKDNE